MQAIAQHPESSRVSDIKDIDALVHHQMIDHWDLKDEPEHLKTIRDRILADDHRATRLLGLVSAYSLPWVCRRYRLP